MKRLRIARRALLGLALVTACAAANAPLDVRVALVIGNGAYPAEAALPNPVNDAAAMSAALRQLGFRVTELRDATREQMAAAIAGVRTELAGKQAVGLFYYAGHGLQLDWRNYMVPVDARLNTAADVAREAVDVDAVIAAFKAAGNRVNIVVLDACRDNPFPGAGGARGLAPLDAPPGTFLAYATAPGHVAEDGRGSNGLYTGYLLRELTRPAARIEDVFKRVRLQVRQSSNGRQIPWESTSLEDDFRFNDGRAAATTAAPVNDDRFAREKADWDRIKDSRRPEDFFAFLQKYPNGFTSEAAQDRLDQLAAPQVVAAPAKGRERVQRDPRVGDEVEYVYRDYYTGLETRRETVRVTAVRDGIVEFNGGQQSGTISGGTIRNDSGVSFDPPLQLLPVGDIQIGRRWQARSVQTLPAGRGGSAARPWQGWVQTDLKVAAYEEIATPAGTFKAWRIEGVLRNEAGLYGELRYWVNGNGVVVRLERKARLANGADDSWIREAGRTQRVPRS